MMATKGPVTAPGSATQGQPALTTSQLVQNFEKVAQLDERALERLAKLASATNDTPVFHQEVKNKR